ncbi:MAG: MFS transporter, partial [Micropruina sp.]|nr:MFS transporter [Micropruina sp.]
MNVALTSIMADLNVAERAAQWLTTGFLLTMAVVIPITGWLLERLTTRTMFGLAMGLFSLGTLACALAPNFALLLGGRIIQATGTAVMLPLLMTTVMQLVPANGRGKIMGNISLVISVAPAIGPTMSGLVLAAFSWRFIFVLVLPIAIGMLVLGLRRMVNVGEVIDVPLDVISIPLTVVGFGGLVYGLSMVGDASVAVWEPGVAVAVGLVGLTALMLRQLVLQKRDQAFLDLRTFTYPTFSVSIVMMAIAMMALFGTIITLPLILQRSLNLDPLTVGLMLFPGGVLMGVLGPVV